MWNFHLNAQNNLSLSYKDAASAPQNLTICGDPSHVTVAVDLDANGTGIAKQISASVGLFKGMRFVSFDSDNSSPGVSLINGANIFKPVFGLPDLNDNGVKQALISFYIQADCRYLDTLSLNDQLLVKDRWDFSYQDQFGNPQSETNYTSEYRDALKLPFISMTVSNNANKPKAGEVFIRTIKISNSGLAGYIKSLNYENLQSQGVSIQGIKVNGHSVVFTKTPNFAGDTLIATTIDGNLFKDNTIGIGTPGNGNTLLEPDELVTVIETGVLVSCTLSRKSLHAASWGCFSETCTRIEKQDDIQVASGVVYIDFKNFGSIPDANAGYCKVGSSTVTFTNAGVEVDPGTAMMFNVSTGIGLGKDLLTADGGYKITSLKIAGVNIPINQISSSVDLNNNPLFSSDPDGPGGFTDADGDGFYDDLPRNEHFEITIQYEVDCNFPSSVSSQKFCTNNLTTSFHGRLDYTNYCGEKQLYTTNSYFGPVNLNDSYEDCSDPDAYTDGDIFYITHDEIRNVFNFEKNCNGEEKFLVSVVLPQGVTAVTDQIALKRLSEVFPLLSHNQVGDTLQLVFDASLNPYLNGTYKIYLAFKADCDAIPGKSIFPINFQFYCPSCDCKHPFYCNDIIGPVIHYNSPPCSPNIQYLCQEGFRTLAFDVNRTSLGFKDKNYTIPISPAEANLKAAISCDSIRMNVLSVVGQNDISDSIGIQIRYSNVDKSYSNIETFLYDKGKLRITHNGQVTVVDVPKSVLSVHSIDSLKLLNFDLNEILESTGLTLNFNDTLQFIANFSLNPDGPYPTPFKKVPNLRAKAYHIVDGIEYNCDDNGETFMIGKTKNGFAFPNSSSFPKGCAESYLEYSLIQVNNGYNDIFPNEYRAAARVDSLEFTYDPAILDAYSIFEPEVAIPGHPIHGNNYFKVPAFDNSGKYIIRFDTLQYVPPLNVVGSYAFTFRIKAIPNCKALSGSSVGSNRFDFDPTLHYKGRYYASIIGNGSCVDDQHNYVDDDVIYNDPPLLSFGPEGPANVAVVNDTAIWTVRLCNTSKDGDAGITWLSFESSDNNDFQLVSMEDITDNNNHKLLSIKSFGANNKKYFAFDDGLTTTQNGSASVDDICNIIRIKAKVKDCGSTTYLAKAGWNCIPYTDPDWNPELYAPCTDLPVNLSVVSSDPFIDANFVNQNINGESICDTTVLEILVRNVDLGKAYDIKTQLVLPLAGASFVPGSVQVAYPSSAPFVKAINDPKFVGVSLKGTIYEYDDFKDLSAVLDQNGLDGFDANNPSTTNEFRIRFSFVTDCDFRSGSLAYHIFQGLTGCNHPTNIDAGESLPIIINGALLVPPKSYMVSIDPSSQIIAGGISTIGVTAMNLLDTPTDASDRISIKLPPGLNYVNASSIALNPGNWPIQDPSISTSNGFTILDWVMPSGVVKNGKISLSFSVDASAVDCDISSLEIGAETVAEKSLDCSLNNTTCHLKIITSDGGTGFFAIPVFPPQITITSSAPAASCSGDPILLVASGGSGYIWYNTSDGSIAGFGDSIYVKPSTVTTYKVVGGSASCSDSSTITVVTLADNHPPVIIDAPDDITVLCSEPIPAPAVITATDDCDTNVEISFEQHEVQIDTCVKVIVRTWTAKDDLGNTTSAQQSITLIDNSPPVITLLDPLIAGHVDGDTILVNCANPPIFTSDDASVTDNCDPNPTIKFVDLASFKGNCADQGFYLLMYCAWSAKDHCGNESKIRLYFKFTDNDPPVLINVPTDITLNQGDPIPNPSTVTASDLCDNDVDVIYTQNTTKKGCETIITRTWTAKDDCGNMASATQTITIHGVNGSIKISNVPADITIECNTVIPAPGNPTAKNDCGTSFSLTFKEGMNAIDPCHKQIIRTWTADDGQGNTASAQQIITIIDTQAPVITFINPILIGHVDGDTITIDCNNPSVFDVNDATATDNCDQNPSLDFIDLAIFKGNCAINGYYLLMYCEWFAEDNCGNTSQIKLYFKFIDNQPPVLSNLPDDITLNYGDPVPDPAIVSADDVCDETVNLTFTQDTVYVGCETWIIRKWTATDDCLNSVTDSQTIKIKCYTCVQPNLSNITVVDATCNSLGSVTITQNNPEKFNYDWLPNLGTPVGVGNIRTNLPSGIYTVIVSDKLDANCLKKASIHILKPACKDTLYLSGNNDENIDTCLTALIDVSPITSVSVCHDDPNTASIITNGNSPCISIVPNSNFIGTESLCIVYCNNNFCDTTIIIIQLKDPNTIPPCQDFIKKQSVLLHPEICANGSNLCLEILYAEIGNYSISSNGAPYQGPLLPCFAGSIEGTVLNFKKGSYHVVFTNNITGCQDSIDVNVVCTSAANFIDTIAIGQKKTYILDQSELQGQGVNINNISPVNNGNSVVYNANYTVFGIDYAGVKAGTSDAVYIYSDELGVTDTVYLRVTVLENMKIDPPLAVDDEISTKKNIAVYWNLLQNDHFSGKLNTVTVNVPAGHGKTVITDSGVVGYYPDKDYCGKDRFSYRICNNEGCDDADVFVDVICKGIVIYNGFSPNGDGNNDYFTIQGIEEFPGNNLKVFNRWGQEVYQATDYKNNWDGTWENKLLTDGTYFYILTISPSESYTGYIYLTR